MLRTLFLLSILGLVGYGFYSWATGGLEPGNYTKPPKDAKHAEANGEGNKPPVVPPIQDVQVARPSGSQATVHKSDSGRGSLEPLVISDARIGIIEFVD